jgi:Domain of unknown function (DUF4166)/Saccharopine dehydrogenase NADP binding domain
VIGGSGAFGRRLADLLLRTTPFEVIVAGRDRARFEASFAANPGVGFVTLDARWATAEDLRGIGAFAAVDAAGPFQGSDLRFPRTVIAAGIHYVDLADARDFVGRFGELDADANAAGVVALTGASSTPALSNAVLDRLTEGWSEIDRVEIAISPGNRAPRGLSVVQAILSYAGKPVRVRDCGRWLERPGWGLTVHRTLPGLGRRWLSLVETPDLDIVAERTGARTVLFRAGLELSVLHLGLATASLLVRAGLLRSLAPFARAFRRIAELLLPFGTDRGGMIVDAYGCDAQRCPAHGSWWLLAEAGDGPFVPVLPALAALRMLADGSIASGARPCVGVVPLDRIEAEFDLLRITTGMQVGVPACLYADVLKADFDLLPAPLRRLHEPVGATRHRGIAEVQGPGSVLARMFAGPFRFPAEPTSVPVTVDIVPSPGRERWTRDFGGRSFASTLQRSARPGCIVERFGPLSFELHVQVEPDGVRAMRIVAWWFGPLRLPRVLAPRSAATERVDEQGRFCFDVELTLPFGLGRLVRYRGWLEPETAGRTAPPAGSLPPQSAADSNPPGAAVAQW